MVPPDHPTYPPSPGPRAQVFFFPAVVVWITPPSLYETKVNHTAKLLTSQCRRPAQVLDTGICDPLLATLGPDPSFLSLFANTDVIRTYYTAPISPLAQLPGVSPQGPTAASNRDPRKTENPNLCFFFYFGPLGGPKTPQVKR